MSDAAGAFARLLAGRSRDPGLLDATVRAARDRSPLVAALPEEDTRWHTGALIDGTFAALVGGGEPGEGVLRAAELLGSDRARQGVPVAALLDGFQAGRTHLIRMIIEEGRAQDVPAEVLLDGLARIDEITTALVHRMVHAHRVAELEAVCATQEGHVQALRRLLHGEHAGMPAPLDPGALYHCVVGEVGDPALAQRLGRALTTTGTGLSGLVDGRFAALITHLPGRVPAGGLPLLVAAPPVPPGEVAGLYGLCRRALSAAGAAARTGLCRLTDLALLTATAAEPDLGRMLAADLLGALDPGDPFHRELAGTALTYLDHGGRIAPAAGALHVHANTVKYRIRRLRELTGGPPADASGTAVSGAVHWWWALRCWLDG